MRGREIFPIRAAVGAGSVTAIANLPVYLVGTLATMIRPDLGFSSIGTGGAVSLFMATSALSGLVLGRWVQDWGTSVAVRVGAGVTGLSMLGIAVFAHNWVILAGLLVVAGGANATAQMAANMVLAERSSPINDGLAFGTKQAAVPLATMLAGLSVPVVLGAIDWRWVFVFGAGLAGTIAVIIPQFVVGGISTSRTGAGGDTNSKKPLDRMVIGLVTVGAFFAAGAATSFAIFIVEFAVSTGWTPGAAGTLLAVGSIGVLLSRIAAGWIIDLRTSRGGSPVALKPASIMMALGSAGMLLVMIAGRSPTLLVVGAMLSLIMGWGWPGLMHLAVVSMNREVAARSTGFILVGVFGGGVVMPVLLGLIAEYFSYQAGWGLNAVFLGVAAGAFYWAHSVYFRRTANEAGLLYRT